MQGQARLDIIQNVSFKYVELLSLPFARSSEATARDSITFRYAKAKAQAAVVQSKLSELVQLVKVKNPSLLLALTQQKPGGGGGGPLMPALSSSTAGMRSAAPGATPSLGGR